MRMEYWIYLIPVAIILWMIVRPGHAKKTEVKTMIKTNKKTPGFPKNGWSK